MALPASTDSTISFYTIGQLPHKENIVLSSITSYGSDLPVGSAFNRVLMALYPPLPANNIM